MRIGITGATGVLGSRIVQVLERRGYAVSGFAGDVRDPDAVGDWAGTVDAIVHCAAVVPVRQVADHAGAAIEINVGGTATVASAAARLGKRLVYVSTSHVYRSSDDPLAEDAPLAPVSLYGLTKLQGEEWVERLAPKALILRLFSYFDERQASSFLVPGLRARIGAAAPGAAIELFGGYNRRDMASATWLAEACTALFDTGATGIVNCATGSDLTVLAIAERMAAAMGRPDISWTVIQDRPVDTLISDNRRMRGIVPDLPDFDLDAALAAYARDAAPRSENGTQSRLSRRTNG